MKTTMLGLLAETALHSGAGRSAGIIDLPVAREAATDYPYIPGSGLKGALKDHVKNGINRGDPDTLFGKSDHAGQLLISDMRLLLLPVRSLTGTYRWVTCPHVLERFGRDRQRCNPGSLPILVPKKNVVTDAQKPIIFLEERECVLETCPEEVVAAIGPLIAHKSTRARLPSQMLIVTDDEFTWFCRYALPVRTRNVLDPETKQSKNLWYEESLPTDSVFYAMISDRADTGSSTSVAAIFPEENAYMQIGGNETVGHGWVAVSVYEVQS